MTSVGSPPHWWGSTLADGTTVVYNPALAAAPPVLFDLTAGEEPPAWNPQANNSLHAAWLSRLTHIGPIPLAQPLMFRSVFAAGLPLLAAAILALWVDGWWVFGVGVGMGAAGLLLSEARPPKERPLTYVTGEEVPGQEPAVRYVPGPVIRTPEWQTLTAAADRTEPGSSHASRLWTTLWEAAALRVFEDTRTMVPEDRETLRCLTRNALA